MKKLILASFALLAMTPIFAQGSLIGDLMTVAPMEAEQTEDQIKIIEEYTKTNEESIAKLDEDIAKLDENYTNEVTKIMETFAKVLEKGDEQGVKNEKLRVVTQVNSKTIFLRKNKKNLVAVYNSKMLIDVFKLPKMNRKEQEDEVKTTVKDYRAKFETEYHANQASIASFKNTKHLITPKPGAASSSAN